MHMGGGDAFWNGEFILMQKADSSYVWISDAWFIEIFKNHVKWFSACAIYLHVQWLAGSKWSSCSI